MSANQITAKIKN